MHIAVTNILYQKCQAISWHNGIELRAETGLHVSCLHALRLFRISPISLVRTLALVLSSPYEKENMLVCCDAFFLLLREGSNLAVSLLRYTTVFVPGLLGMLLLLAI